METAERLDHGAGECARCGHQLPGGPDCPTRLAGADSRSAGFWRPWVDTRGEHEEAPHQAEKGVSERRAAGRASERCRWFTRTGNTRPEGDSRPVCPFLKITPAVVLSVLKRRVRSPEQLRHKDRIQSEAAENIRVTFPAGARNAGSCAFPVSRKRLFWPKSKCYDYLYQEAEALLKNFPIQATISFYEDSDSEDEIEELICENESD
ncbi:protein ripply2 isoform X1 [Phyllostomus discolor]|uniref:Protein ripply2 isoform X1 n=1 Tax=Phyllostomus discolor TaxID=89673 RepID=A0A7E6DN85_9CHIR|nr:protein ripply2 isoform X1 [Phyllostomus discolor]